VVKLRVAMIAAARVAVLPSAVAAVLHIGTFCLQAVAAEQPAVHNLLIPYAGLLLDCVAQLLLVTRVCRCTVHRDPGTASGL
jgi:hypothetical protein